MQTEPTNPLTAACQESAPCSNLANGRCTPRCHDAMQAMLAGRQSMPDSGSLFPLSPYPDFENGKCTRYVREYLPLHMPQLEHGIEKAFQALQGTLPVGKRPIRVLDVGSGPASVALALERLTAGGRIKGEFEVHPVDPSGECCAMLRAAAGPLRTGAVALREPQRMTLEQYTSCADAYPCDWIIMANVLSPLAIGRTVEDYCDGILRLLAKHRTAAGYPALTLIEGSCTTYVDPRRYMMGLVRQLKVVCEVGLGVNAPPLHSPDILNCTFYRRNKRGCSPRIIMVTLRKVAT